MTPRNARLRRLNRAARRGGSAMILVIATIVVLLLIGLSLVSVAQMQRIAGAAQQRSGKGDEVVVAARDYVGQKLADDFNLYLTATTTSEQVGRYMTYPDPVFHPVLSPCEPVDLDPLTDSDGDGDATNDWDAWTQITQLASNPVAPAPANDFLNIKYLKRPGDTTMPSGEEGVAVASLAIPFKRMDLLTTQERMEYADADGDGYSDSRYAELPIPPVDNLRWAIATRVVDNSGSIDLNTSSEAEFHHPSDQVLAGVYGTTPADVDLKRFLATTNFNSTIWASTPYAGLDLRGETSYASNASVGNSGAMPYYYGSLGLLGTTGTAAPIYATPVTDYVRRNLIWANLGRRLDAPAPGFTPIPMADDAELSLRRGLNHRAFSSLEGLLDGRMTSGLGPLRALHDESGMAPLTPAQLRESARSKLTAYSGARQLRPRWAGGSDDARLSLDLLTTDNAAEYEAAFAAALQSGAGNFEGRGVEAASAFTASLLADRYGDRYNPLPAQYPPAPTSTDVRFLPPRVQPFLREALSVIVYTDKLATDPVSPEPNADIDPATEETHRHVVVELGNPWPGESLPLYNYFIRLNGSDAGILTVDNTAAPTYLTMENTATETYAMAAGPASRVVIYSGGDPNLQAAAAAIESDATKRNAIPLSWSGATACDIDLVYWAVQITNPGSGYSSAAPPIFALTAPAGGSAATAWATVVDGKVTGLRLGGGSGYVPPTGGGSFSVSIPGGSATASITPIVVDSLRWRDNATTPNKTTPDPSPVVTTPPLDPAFTQTSTWPVAPLAATVSYGPTPGDATKDGFSLVLAASLQRDDGAMAGGGFRRYVFENPNLNYVETMPPTAVDPGGSPGTFTIPLLHKMATEATANTASYGAAGTLPAFQLIPMPGRVSRVSLLNRGSGYSPATPPTVTFTPDPINAAEPAPTVVATAEATLGPVLSLNLTNGGAGYAVPPQVVLSGGGGYGARARATLAGGVVTGLTLLENGAGYASVPTVSFVGGGGSGATATAAIDATALAEIIVTEPGAGYNRPPILTISGGGGAQAIAHLGGAVKTVGDLGNLLTYAHHYDPAGAVSAGDPYGAWRPVSAYLGQATTTTPLYTVANGRLDYGGGMGDYKLPLAAAVYEQFTCLPGSPGNHDMVYGLINPNTAPRRVLEMLPYVRQGGVDEIVNNTSQWDLARGMIAYRDKTAAASGSIVDYSGGTGRATKTGVANLREELGLASVGELQMVRRTGTAGADDQKYLMTRGALDTVDSYMDGGGTALGDLTPAPGTADGVVDDLEEENLHFARVANLLSIRSDVFTAYVVLQGMEKDPNDATGQAWRTAVTRRFIVTYDRSNVDGSGGVGSTQPRVVMFTEER